ncbi:hypothetical protein [Bacillus sp. Marseille-Q7846]
MNIKTLQAKRVLITNKVQRGEKVTQDDLAIAAEVVRGFGHANDKVAYTNIKHMLAEQRTNEGK